MTTTPSWAEIFAEAERKPKRARTKKAERTLTDEQRRAVMAVFRYYRRGIHPMDTHLEQRFRETDNGMWRRDIWPLIDRIIIYINEQAAASHD